ncbi:MAG: 4-phosphoerythronate dehydrogenase [Gammaproteobacteria bacterium]|nr:4-phosphoerythronate dehydrogenase [Gammaproteobacteria bacterium]
MLRIVADNLITEVEPIFAPLGEVTTAPGRTIDRALLQQADVLLVRSVTRVDADLLRDTPVRFVGSATAGLDHVDLDWLAANGIRFASAPGSNARAVAEYVLAATFAIRGGRGIDNAFSVGVIGFGHVGQEVVRLFESLGARCLISDPPRAVVLNDREYLPLADVLGCDLVTVHTPLTRTGPHATAGLLGVSEIQRLTPGAILVNAARGGVVDEAVLLARLAGDVPLSAVIDCWQGEPSINADLLAAATIASPHIAGHSREAKLRGTMMIFTQLAAYAAGSPPPSVNAVEDVWPWPDNVTVAEVPDRVARHYDIAADSARFIQLPADVTMAAWFDRWRGAHRRHEYTISRGRA